MEIIENQIEDQLEKSNNPVTVTDTTTSTSSDVTSIRASGDSDVLEEKQVIENKIVPTLDLDKLNNSYDANENSIEENCKENMEADVKVEVKIEPTEHKPTFENEAEKVPLMNISTSKKSIGNGIENNESIHQKQPIMKIENTVTLSNHKAEKESVSSKIDPNFRGTDIFFLKRSLDYLIGTSIALLIFFVAECKTIEEPSSHKLERKTFVKEAFQNGDSLSNVST